MYKRIYIWLYVFLFGQIAFGHGDLHERILHVSEEIKARPDSAQLYLKRGELYYQHHEFENSLRDFRSCEERGYRSLRLDLGFARSFERMDRFSEALAYLGSVLRREPHHVTAIQLKARVLFRQGNYSEAAQQFELVITYSDQTFPLNYFEASGAWEKSGGKDGLRRAIASIERGLQDLGGLLNFYERLVELYCSNADFDTALYYQDLIVDSSRRKEWPCYERALIQLEKGDPKAARRDMLLALHSIQNLPDRVKNNMSTMTLKAKIDNHLERLSNTNTKQTN